MAAQDGPQDPPTDDGRRQPGQEENRSHQLLPERWVVRLHQHPQPDDQPGGQDTQAEPVRHVRELAQRPFQALKPGGSLEPRVLDLCEQPVQPPGQSYRQLIHLFDIYGGLLTTKQQGLMRLYYHDDLSLGEIAERLQITRQAVYDSLHRSMVELTRFERHLGLVRQRTSGATE